ncbi:RES domain-containing protein [Litorivivens lipolytica]|uniref:RES domain-containing protein n=1 Tax=Litorivivens lipolytica TaxID=1524264 RepID=UPI001621733E
MEHQATIATMNVVHGNLAKHDILESVLEDSKPALPEDTAGLHWLAATPFRYMRARESRWGRTGTRGIWYGALSQEVALRECIFHRRAFFDAYRGDKPHTLEMSLIQAKIDTPAAVDFTAPRYNRIRKKIEDPDDYSACHAKADVARKSGAHLIAYNSARTPDTASDRLCVAVMNPQAFSKPSIICEGKTVSLSVDDKRIRAYFNASRTTIEFSQESLDWQQHT